VTRETRAQPDAMAGSVDRRTWLIAKCSTSSAPARENPAATNSNTAPGIRPLLVTLASRLLPMMVHLPRRAGGLVRLRGRTRMRAQKMLECRARSAAAPDFSGIIGGHLGPGGGKGSDGMKVVCASCRVEGRSGDLGQKAPLDDPSETHGYCPRHAALLLASLPSLSFPDVELLIVVRRPDVPLFEYLQHRLAEVRGVKVILERRGGDRRRDLRQRAPDRRRLRRRLRLGQASSLGYTVVRFRPR